MIPPFWSASLCISVAGAEPKHIVMLGDICGRVGVDTCVHIPQHSDMLESNTLQTHRKYPPT